MYYVISVKEDNSFWMTIDVQNEEELKTQLILYGEMFKDDEKYTHTNIDLINNTIEFFEEQGLCLKEISRDEFILLNTIRSYYDVNDNYISIAEIYDFIYRMKAASKTLDFKTLNLKDEELCLKILDNR